MADLPVNGPEPPEATPLAEPVRWTGEPPPIGGFWQAFLSKSLAGVVRLRRIPLLDDTARFRVDDPDDLVAASFVCPTCLNGEVEVVIEGEDDEHAGRCECRMCASEWTVWLTTWQVVRLRVHPPDHDAGGLGLRVRELS